MKKLRYDEKREDKQGRQYPVVNIPGVGVGMYSGMVGTFSAGNLSKTWEVEPEIVSGKEVVPYGVE